MTMVVVAFGVGSSIMCRRALPLLLLSLLGIILAATASSSALALSRRPLHHGHHRHCRVGGARSGFLSLSPPSSSVAAASCHRRQHRRRHSSSTSISSMIPFFISPFSLLSDMLAEDATTINNGGNSYCYVPPYGMVPRTTTTSSLMMSNNMSDYYPSNNDNYNNNNYDSGSSSSSRRSTSRRNVKEPLIQDFGSLQDWRSSKIGVGRLGDNKVGDDMVNEVRRRRNNNMDVPPPPLPPPPMSPLFEDGEGGNYWVNPTNSMDRYPEPPISPMMFDNDVDIRRDEMMMMMPRRNTGAGRRRNSSIRSRNFVDDDDDEDGEWWETRRRGGGRNDDDYYDEEDMLDRFDDDDEFEDDEYSRRSISRRQRGGEFGVPPPTRSRSSFRTGAPPPPRPVKQFYDKLFWFGFDPDATQPTDRTMFGGTRGKFNAVDLLRDREERQRYYRGSGRRIPSSSSSSRSGGSRDSVIQDFGSVQDWNARKTGRGRTGGDAVGDDVVNRRRDFDSSFDDGYFRLDNDVGRGGRVVQRGRNNRGGGDRQQQERRRSAVDRRAEEYNRIIGLGRAIDDGDEYELGRGSPSSRRRSGFAYKYSDDDIDLLYDDGEYIDVEPRYASERDLDMARAELSSESSASQRRRRRSWEERAMDMDRVPPRDAIAWGPNGPVGSGGPLESAAMDALRDIKKSKLFLERKENDVEDAKNEVVNLKANASLCQSKLDDAPRGGREASQLEQELGYILRDVEDASRNLRLARAERDAASNRVSDLEERNWALLSEFEATTSFEDDLVG